MLAFKHCHPVLLIVLCGNSVDWLSLFFLMSDEVLQPAVLIDPCARRSEFRRVIRLVTQGRVRLTVQGTRMEHLAHPCNVSQEVRCSLFPLQGEGVSEWSSVKRGGKLMVHLNAASCELRGFDKGFKNKPVVKQV